MPRTLDTISLVISLSKLSTNFADPIRTRCSRSNVRAWLHTATPLVSWPANTTHTGLASKRAASCDRNGHAHAQGVYSSRRDHHKTMTVHHFSSNHRIGINPIDVALSGRVATTHQMISRPTGSPSDAHAVSLLSSRTCSAPFNNSAAEKRLRDEEEIGFATNSPRSTLSSTCDPTSRSRSFKNAGGMIMTAAPPCRRIVEFIVIFCLLLTIGFASASRATASLVGFG